MKEKIVPAGIELVAVGERSILKALGRVVACQSCSASVSRSFSSVLIDVLGAAGPISEYVLCAPARCPSCAQPIVENTLVRCEAELAGGESRLVGGRRERNIHRDLGLNTNPRIFISPTEQLIRQFLHGTGRLDRSLNATLIRLHQWASVVLTEGFETAMACVLGEEGCANALELVSTITDSIVSQGKQMDRDVLCKSVEETLFLSIGPDPLLTRSEFDVRCVHFLQRHGISALLRILLSQYLFNIVCLQTEASFRMLAGTEESFQRYMEQVEHTCRRIVRAVWMFPNGDPPSWPRPIPQNLIEAIERRLWDA